MAITITQEPTGWVYARNRLIITASSTNVANTGFRFIFDVLVAGETTTYTVSPNPSNVGILDPSKLIQTYLSGRLAADIPASQSSINQLGTNTANLHLNEVATNAATTTCQVVTVTVKEGWIIAGVFTPTVVGQDTTTFVAHNMILPGNFKTFNSDYQNGNNGLTDRTIYTGINEFEMKESYGLLVGSGYNIVCTPLDNGIITYITDDGTYYQDGFIGDYTIRGVIYDSSGAPTTKDITITAAAGQITHFGCYPANLDASTIGIGFFKPIDFPNYRFYTIQILDSLLTSMGEQHIFFNKDYQCKQLSYENNAGQYYCRIGWINDFGGWDYMNFDYKCEYTQKSERKRMRQVVGDYVSTTYSSQNYDRGLAETSVFSDRTMSLTSKKLDGGQFRLLSSLLRSKQVFMLSSLDGYETVTNIRPIVIESSDNTEFRPLDTKQRDFTLIARESNPMT